MNMPVIGSTGPGTTFASWPGFGLWRRSVHSLVLLNQFRVPMKSSELANSSLLQADNSCVLVIFSDTVVVNKA